MLRHNGKSRWRVVAALSAIAVVPLIGLNPSLARVSDRADVLDNLFGSEALPIDFYLTATDPKINGVDTAAGVSDRSVVVDGKRVKSVSFSPKGLKPGDMFAIDLNVHNSGTRKGCYSFAGSVENGYADAEGILVDQGDSRDNYGGEGPNSQLGPMQLDIEILKKDSGQQLARGKADNPDAFRVGRLGSCVTNPVVSGGEFDTYTLNFRYPEDVLTWGATSKIVVELSGEQVIGE